MSARFFSLFLFLGLLLSLPGCRLVITGAETGPADPRTEPVIVEEAVALTPEPAVEATATASPRETALPVATEEPAAGTGAFCPEIPRPALLLYVLGERYVILDPTTGASCDLSVFPGEAVIPRAGGNGLFYIVREGDERLAIHRITAGGSDAALPATAVNLGDGYRNLDFAVSGDGTTIAWVVSGPGENGSGLLSDLYVAPVSSAEDTPVAALVAHSAPERPEVLYPVRFSDDKSVLFYTLLPQGIGGSWIAFSGRYQNLYAVQTAGGQPELIFDCATLELGLCLGDFLVQGNEVVAVAYTDYREGVVVITNGEGEIMSRQPVDTDYVGYPTFGPGGDLVFYSASLAETESMPLPEVGSIHRVAPPTAGAEVLVTDPGVVLPDRFLDENRLIVGYAFDETTWGLALVNLNGEAQPIKAYPAAMLLDLLR